MFELTVEREFCAAHALRLKGIPGGVEPLHGHNFRVRVTLGASELDEDGLVLDFHAVEREVDGVLSRWNNRNLNEVEEFQNLSPSAEHIARTIAQKLHVGLARSGVMSATGGGKPRVRIVKVFITEAPGCSVEYFPEGGGLAMGGGQGGS